MGMLVGTVVAVMLLALEGVDAGPIRAINHWAYDSVTRLVAGGTDAATPTSGPRLTLADVDDTTWRDLRWGGGEPVLAPPEGLAMLVDRAFSLGAGMLVLDVLTEGGVGEGPLPGQHLLVKSIEQALAEDAQRWVVLVRSVRAPPILPMAGDAEFEARGFYLSELRSMPMIDDLVARSAGRVVLAAPYFVFSSDHVLRDWQLFQVVCHRVTKDTGGVLRVVPSVQLAVLAWHHQWPVEKLPWLKDHGRCRPFPRPEPELVRAEQLYRASAYSRADFETLERSVAESTWRQLRALGGTRLNLPAALPKPGNLSNRVVFRYETAPRSLPARSLLWDDSKPHLTLSGDVVVIGQSYAESGDHHPTPLGVMPGATVLVNAIDSFARLGVVRKPALPLKALILIVEIVVVAAIYALGGALIGQLAATVTAMLLLIPTSALLFQHGVWLTFALPLLAIQAHAWFDLVREHRDLAKLHRSSDGTSGVNQHD